MAPASSALRVDDLRYLLAVARTGRLVAAAAYLRVDHTTVSRRLRALERALGAPLLERGAEGWELTELGRRVAQTARPIEEAIDGVLLAAAGAPDDVVAGNFRISAPDGFTSAFVVPALTKLRKMHPKLTVELLTATRQLTLHQSGFDLAIAVGASVSRRLFAEELCRYRLALYATSSYLEEYGRPSSLDDLGKHTVIFYVDSMLQVGDLDPTPYLPGVEARFASTSIFAQLEATASGAGIGFLPRFMALRQPQLVELDWLDVNAELGFTLAARRESVTRPAFQAVRKGIHAEVRARSEELLGATLVKAD